jgi:2-C-methyl-D-erythritol 4-phosphate cytidylyltransferase/2-C-methyl-D-erythritol 2,4-cyclodiphosphate synthase
MRIRVGNGFDVHQLRDGKKVTLCGVDIHHDKELVGHSDADVAMHALTDAIFGALAEGDIGVHFPPTDQKWLGTKSEVFLVKAIDLMKEHGYLIANIDITIICERPKVATHALAMRANIAKLCEIKVEQVSVKGTTSERLGFTGREEGIAAIATALLQNND